MTHRHPPTPSSERESEFLDQWGGGWQISQDFIFYFLKSSLGPIRCQQVGSSDFSGLLNPLEPFSTSSGTFSLYSMWCKIYIKTTRWKYTRRIRRLNEIIYFQSCFLYLQDWTRPEVYSWPRPTRPGPLHLSREEKLIGYVDIVLQDSSFDLQPPGPISPSHEKSPVTYHNQKDTDPHNKDPTKWVRLPTTKTTFQYRAKDGLFLGYIIRFFLPRSVRYII